MTLPSNDDLIWRLRNEAQDGSNSVWVQADCCKAAERLEAMEAENARLKAELETRAEHAEKYAEHLLQVIIFLLKCSENGETQPEAWRTVERKFYRSEWPVSKLLEARHGGLVVDEGESWRYVYSGKDGTGGEYDLLRRKEPLTEGGA